MTTRNLYLTALKSWLELVSGMDPVDVYLSDQNGPDRPPGTPHITFKEIGGDSRDYPLMKRVDVDDDFLDVTWVNPGTSVVSINVWDKAGFDMLKKLYLSRAMMSPRKVLATGGCVLLSMSAIRNLTATLENSVVDPRFQADFTFNVWFEDIESRYKAKIFDVNGHIENDDIQILADTIQP